MSKWHKGPPPSIGWWPCSNDRTEGCIRWWNGEYWSRSAWDDGMGPKEGAKRASIKDPHGPFEWKHRPKDWPDESHT